MNIFRLVFISLSVFVLGCNAPTTQPVEQKPAAPTAQAIADKVKETTPSASLPSAAQGCDVGQNITVKLTSAAEIGQGCQQGGGIAQKTVPTFLKSSPMPRARRVSNKSNPNRTVRLKSLTNSSSLPLKTAARSKATRNAHQHAHR